MSALRKKRLCVVHGEDKSGKTALAKYLMLSHIRDEQPALFVDFSTLTGRPKTNVLGKLYEEQYYGDYTLWCQQDSKSLIIDNMSEAASHLDFLEACLGDFEQVHVFVSSDVFFAFFMDEHMLAEFHHIQIEPLSYRNQERLIRKRLITIEDDEEVLDSLVDEAEDRVNNIIISRKIVPRFPFFVLSILHTYEEEMPQDLAITSYGHCYYVFILASLTRAGISVTDQAINSCINFLKELALATFKARREPSSSGREPSSSEFDFSAFLDAYRATFPIRDSILSRLMQDEYGVVANDGRFKYPYMYYYFLGMVLATTPTLTEEYLFELCEEAHLEQNYLIVLFSIHHATDETIIEDLMLRAMDEIDHVAVATLDEAETSRFASIVYELPESILSDNSIEEQRALAREFADQIPDQGDAPDEEERDIGSASASVLRSFKRTKILGQVLRNQSGMLTKTKIEEIVEVIADSSFRLINFILKDESEIRNLAQSLHARWPEASLTEIQEALRMLSFIWTMLNVEHAVHSR